MFHRLGSFVEIPQTKRSVGPVRMRLNSGVLESRFSEDDLAEQRKADREGMKSGDFVSLLVKVGEHESTQVLSGLLHHVVSKPKKKEVPAEFHRIRGFWIWVSSDMWASKASLIYKVEQSICLQTAESLQGTISWSVSCKTCPRSFCAMMGVREVTATAQTLDRHIPVEYKLDAKSLMGRICAASEQDETMQDLVALKKVWPELRPLIQNQPIIPISGPPGTGKTRVSSELLMWFLRMYKKVGRQQRMWFLCTAWTNQAVVVLASVFSEYNPECRVVLVGKRHENAPRGDNVQWIPHFMHNDWNDIVYEACVCF